MRRTILAAVTMAALFGAGFAPGRAGGAGLNLLAINRCDSRNINDLENQIRDWDKHPPRGVDAEIARMNDLQDTIAALGQERGVLEAVCPENVNRAPFNAQIGAATAWALALEADITTAIGPPCPAAGNAVPTQILAGAWLSLSVIVQESGGTVPQSIAEVVPKVQSRAAAVGLTLPSYADASPYWRDQISAASKAAVAACATPTPAPSGSP